MEGGEQDKSELPTQHKLDLARRKGTIARGMDLGFLAVLLGFLGWWWAAGRGFGERLARASEAALVSAPQVAGGPGEILALTGVVAGGVLGAIAGMAAVAFLVVLALELVQTRGLVFSGQPLKPDFNRLNPGNNLKRLFSPRVLIETAKNVLKLAVYVALAWLAVRYALEGLRAVTDARSLAEAMTRTGVRLLAFFAVAAVVFAAFDQMIVRRDFTKKMRMSRREVRREHRDREGEPRMKQRRKQLHAEFAKASQSLRGVKGADVMIVNPTHYAVALRYDPRTMSAPVVSAQGVDGFAQRLKRLAFVYGVPLIEDRNLARALHRCELNAQVPEALFPPVAAVYRGLKSKRLLGNGHV